MFAMENEMTTINKLKAKARLEEQLNAEGIVAKARAKGIAKLVDIGVDPDIAERIADQALEREQLSGYEPGSDERINHALGALDTTVALHSWTPPADDGITFRMPLERLSLNVSLPQIDIDPKVQIRVAGVDPARVEDYRRAMTEGEIFPPLVLFWDADKGILQLADGFHRIEAAKQAGSISLAGTVYAGTYRDAAEYAATCNAKHGLPMTREDKRAAIKRLLDLHTDWSNRRIARLVSCSHNTVESARQELISGGQIDHLTRVVGADKKEYSRAEYASIWQLENNIRNHINTAYGFPGRSDYDPQLGIDYLMEIKWSGYEVPEGLIRAAKYRHGDFIQAVNNVLEQLRQQQRKTEEDQGGATDDYMPVYDSIERHEVEWYKENDIEEEEEQAPITSIDARAAAEQRERIKEALTTGDWRYFRAQVAIAPRSYITAALWEIFATTHRLGQTTATQCIVDAILQPWADASPTEAQTTTGCPDCGGDLTVVEMDGKRRHLCMECGSVLDIPVKDSVFEIETHK